MYTAEQILAFRPDARAALRDPVIRERLDWYVAVLEGRKPAKAIIAATIEAPKDYESMSEEELWRLHDELGRAFDEEWGRVRHGPDQDVSAWVRRRTEPNLLDVKTRLGKMIIRRCYLCERRCGVDRESKRGACLLDKRSRVGSAFLHPGEEAPLTPSGTVFFTGCNFRCAYCQNWDISQMPEEGEEVDEARVAAIASALWRAGARNINWVGGEPTVNMHVILPAIRLMALRGVNAPQLWNTNMYMSVEGLKLLLHVVDIWLPDFKYGNNEHAMRYSAVPRYWETVTRNFSTICSRGENIIIRHLVLPGHVECCTKPILRWIASNCRHALVNIMDQYHPDYLVLRLDKYGDIRRRVTRREMEEAYRYADELGLEWRSVTK